MENIVAEVISLIQKVVKMMIIVVVIGKKSFTDYLSLIFEVLY